MIMTAKNVEKQDWIFDSTVIGRTREMLKMNAYLRESFIELYDSRDILEDLEQSLRIRFPNIDVPRYRNEEHWTCMRSKNSQYFFS